MTKMVIKSVRISSIASWMALFMAVFALVTSVVYTLIFLGFRMTDAMSMGSIEVTTGAQGGFTQFLIIFMFANGVIGFLGGALCGFIYNAYAGRSIARIEFDVENELA